MAWCFSTRTSVATMLSTHPLISRCLWVNFSHNDDHLWHFDAIRGHTGSNRIFKSETFTSSHSLTMMTSSNGNTFHDTGPLCREFTGHRWIPLTNSSVIGEFPSQRPVTQSFDVFCDLCLNKWLSKQSCGWWFEMLSCSWWRHCDDASNTNQLREQAAC